jgi:hypothetical protein
MAHAFLLLHNPPETGKVKVIGIYSSEALAEAAMQQTRVQCSPEAPEHHKLLGDNNLELYG